MFLLHNWLKLRQRIAEQGRPTISWTVRLTASGTAAYAAAITFFDHQPLLAPLSALLVTQITLYRIVRQTLDRMLALISGVIVASLFTSFVGLTWWSLALLLAVSLLLGQLMRLKDNMLEVPVTAMYVMAVQVGTSVASYQRIVSTLIGALVGLLVNVLLPPSVRTSSAGAAIERYGEDIAVLLDTAAEQLPKGVNFEQSEAWLRMARGLDYKTIHIDDLISRSQESRVLNVRALNIPDSNRGLRDGLYALEHGAVSIRSVFRGIYDAVHHPDDIDDGYPQEARDMTAQILREYADVIRAYARLTRVHAVDERTVVEARLNSALERLTETRKVAFNRAGWLNDPVSVQELNSFLNVATGRILREFNPKAQTWSQRRPAAYGPPVPAMAIEAAAKLKLQAEKLANKSGSKRRRNR